MASLADIQNLMEQLEARMEARMNEALAAQRTALIAELGSGNGNGASAGGSDPATSNQGPAAGPTSSNPALNLDDMPSRTAAELEAQKMKEKLELLERSSFLTRTKLSLFKGMTIAN
ncbi:hypothetical protein JCGZ_12685 [Jatropha curcas]|uniref:Uncharacterized protein n=1 Tax=Jatropha curcas TaxID=180498 RepID=A0A067KRE5_JATCU|nr:hypothetical protein JCGZ_12685 [Jatropha curcas]